MSNFTDAFGELRDCFQEESDSSPTLTFGSDEVACIPGEVGQDPMMVGGGIAEGATIVVQTLESDWTTLPEKNDVVALADHATAPDGNYRVMSLMFREGTVSFTLGNDDAS